MGLMQQHQIHFHEPPLRARNDHSQMTPRLSDRVVFGIGLHAVFLVLRCEPPQVSGMLSQRAPLGVAKVAVLWRRTYNPIVPKVDCRRGRSQWMIFLSFNALRMAALYGTVRALLLSPSQCRGARRTR